MAQLSSLNNIACEQMPVFMRPFSEDTHLTTIRWSQNASFEHIFLHGILNRLYKNKLKPYLYQWQHRSSDFEKDSHWYTFNFFSDRDIIYVHHKVVQHTSRII
ncbi:hypothetical protein CEXT_191101 [Caerostris extrusa]|uniref:Uncharacterized protein n=1 Tax=Caerostris extrusa TaxID=172846 RepID=A0AAV4Q7I8_CAEEX|nr:hypothetical protein CEXT_191101 [Caerostris extrusa]